MNLCVIGNSHVGMIRAALRGWGPGAPACTFFAKPGRGIEKAQVEGARLVARDAELRAEQARFAMPTELDVNAYDAIVLVAGTASIYDALTILQECRVSDWPSGRAPDPARAAGSRSLVSEPAFIAALGDITRAGYSHRFATALRGASDVPMFVVPQPYPSERVFDDTGAGAYGFHRARRHGEGTAIAACLDTAIAEAFRDIAGLGVLHQPAHTVAHGLTTARAYRRDAVRVDGQTAQHETDLLHVGPAYGKQVLARILSALATRMPA